MLTKFLKFKSLSSLSSLINNEVSLLSLVIVLFSEEFSFLFSPIPFDFLKELLSSLDFFKKEDN